MGDVGDTSLPTGESRARFPEPRWKTWWRGLSRGPRRAGATGWRSPGGDAFSEGSASTEVKMAGTAVASSFLRRKRGKWDMVGDREGGRAMGNFVDNRGSSGDGARSWWRGERDRRRVMVTAASWRKGGR